MVKTWETGQPGEFECDNCGAIYTVREKRFPVKDKDRAICEVCGEVMAKWNSTHCPMFELKKAPKRPRDTNELAKEIVDLATMDDDEMNALKKEKSSNQTPGKRGS